MAQKAHSLSHTKWMCKYHIVFTPKYRRKIIALVQTTRLTGGHDFLSKICPNNLE